MNKLVFLFILFVVAIFLVGKLEISGKQTFDVSKRFCEDSDNGISIYTPGFVESDIGTFNDRCFDNERQIREYFCTEGRFGGNYRVGSKVESCGIGSYGCKRDVIGSMDVCEKVSFK